MYRVIVPFTDTQDNSFAYGVNDVYPREGYTPSKSRIKELLNDTNKRNKPLIVEKEDAEKHEEEVAKEVSKEVSEDVGYDY
jgi:hypothetical protein